MSATVLNKQQILTVHSGLPLDHTTIATLCSAWGCAGAHFASSPPTGAPNIGPSRLLLRLQMITEIAKLVKQEVMASHSADCRCGFRACCAQAAPLWACFLLTMLMPVLRDAAKQFLNSFS